MNEHILSATQDDMFNKLLHEATLETRYNNIHNRIVWNSRPTNQYVLDQTKGTIHYQTDDPGINVVAGLEIMGTFNLTDKTFLWADKNPSVNANLSGKVGMFRNRLSEKLQAGKFTSNPDFNTKLLALFSNQLNTNGFKSIRQGDTILYFALMKIDIFEKDRIKSTIAPEPHFHKIDHDSAIPTIKQFHKDKFDVNDRYYNRKELTDKEAFKEIKEVHLKYWLNEDEYYYPALSWPCDFGENSTSDWQVIGLKGTSRIFIVYTADLRWTIEHYAYEISSEADGTKIIIGNF